MSIKIYKTKTCAVCKQVLNYIKYKGHEAEEIYIDDDPKLQQYVYEKSGGFMIVPLTVIEKEDGEHFISGGNIPRIAEMI